MFQCYFNCAQWRRNELESGGGTGLKQKWGHRSEAKVGTLFGSKSTISRFGERFRDGQYGLVSFLFAVLLLTVPPPSVQSFVKVGARAPRAL